MKDSFYGALSNVYGSTSDTQKKSQPATYSGIFANDLETNRSDSQSSTNASNFSIDSIKGRLFSTTSTTNDQN